MDVAGQSSSGTEPRMRRLTPLVGRGDLLALAEAQINEWLAISYDPSTFSTAGDAGRIAGRNRLLVLTGAPAVGKSRLAFELLRRLAGKRPLTTATAHCTAATSLFAFAAELARIAGLDENNLPARWQELCDQAAKAVGESYGERARRHLSLLAFLLDCDAIDTTGIRQADTRSFIPGVKLALRACCELIAQSTGMPVVLVVEDLQWLGGLREVIGDLLKHASLPQPLIVIGTARPEFAATAEELAALVGLDDCASPTTSGGSATPAWRVLELPPLSRLEGARLIREVVPRLKLPAELEEQLARKAAGLPYYYEEFARLLLARQLVTESEDELNAVAELSAMELPEGLAELIQSRLAGLEPSLRDLTGRAAVIGRSFSGERLRVLEEGLGLTDSDQTAQRLALLEQDHLLASEAGDRYFFEHALTRDAAYAMLPDEDRTEMHRAMAATLEEMLIPGTASEWDILPELIRHLKGSSQFQRTHEMACNWLELMGPIGGFEYLDSALEIAQASWWMWRFPDGRAVPRASAAALDGDDPGRFPPSPALHNAIGTLLRHKGNYSQAMNHAQLALDIAKRVGDQSCQMKSLHLVGVVQEAIKSGRALGILNSALEISKTLHDTGTEVSLLTSIAACYVNKKDFQQAITCATRAYDLARRLGNRRAESGALGMLGVIREYMSDWDAAAENFQKTLIINRETGNRLSEALALSNLSIRLAESGNLDKALEYVAEAVGILVEIENVQYEGLVRANWSDFLARQGKYEQAERQIMKAIEIAAAGGDKQSECWYLYDLSLIALHQGKLKRALALAQSARALVDQLAQPANAASVCCGYGQLLAQNGDLDKSRAELEYGTGMLEEIGLLREQGYARCNWVYYYIACAQRLVAAGQRPDSEMNQARNSIAAAEELAERANLPGGSDLYLYIEAARKAIREFDSTRSD